MTQEHLVVLVEMVKKGYKWHQLKKASTRQNKVEGFLSVIFAPLWSKRIKKR